MTTFEKLNIRLKSDLNVEGSHFKRTRSGYWQRASGAWSWCARQIIDGKISAYDIGSPFSAKYLLKYKGKIVMSKDGTILTDD